MSRTMLKGSVTRSGRLGFEFVEDVVGAPADLARDGEHGALAADTRRSLRVEGAVGAVGPLGMLGRFDQRPAEYGCAVLGEVAAASRFAGLLDDRIETGGADRLSCAPEAGRFAELGEQVTGEDRAYPVDRLQRHATPIATSEATQLRLQRAQLALDRFDQTQQTTDLGTRRRRQCSADRRGKMSAAVERGCSGLM